ncbi:hypothetical protein D3C87_2018630 [compost metagenome]
MATFVDGNEIEFQAPARTRQVVALVAHFKSIAISYCALVFHAQVRGLHKLIAVFIKWIWAKPVLKRPEHWFNISIPMRTGFGAVFLQ